MKQKNARTFWVWQMKHTVAGCEGMATTVTGAHHSIWRHLYDSMHVAQKPKSKLKFVTLDKESNMNTL